MGRKRRDDGPTGVLLIDKPAGPTSAEVVDFVRWTLRTRAVGHCGTLDPAATGLLVCCVGAATKLVSYLTDDDKTYRATFVLGRSTTTADAQGEVVDEAPVDDATWHAALEATMGLLGEHVLSPPAYSAVKIDGERAHARARRGEVFEVPTRPMIVHALDDVVRGDRVRAEILATMRVSKGSFIRSFAEELGRRLGVPAHLGALHRLACGATGLHDARARAGFDVSPLPRRPDGKPRHRLRLQGIDDDREAQAAALLGGMISPAEALSLPRVDVSHAAQGDDLALRLGHGQPIAFDHPALAEAPQEGLFAVVEGPGLVLARWHTGGERAFVRVVTTVTPLPRTQRTNS